MNQFYNTEDLANREAWRRWVGEVSDPERACLVSFGLREKLADCFSDPDDAEVALEGNFPLGDQRPSPTKNWDRISRFEYDMATKVKPDHKMEQTAEHIGSQSGTDVRIGRALIRWRIFRHEPVDDSFFAEFSDWERFYFLALSKWAVGEIDQVERILRDSICANCWQNSSRLALASFLARRNSKEALLSIDEITEKTVQVERLRAWILGETWTHLSHRSEPLRYTWASSEKKTRKLARCFDEIEREVSIDDSVRSQIPDLISRKDWKGLKKLSQDIDSSDLRALLEIRLALQAARTKSFDLSETELREILDKL